MDISAIDETILEISSENISLEEIALHSTIKSEIIALNTKWNQNYIMKLLIFFILHNQLYRKQKVVNGDAVFLTVTRHAHVE